MNDTQLKELAKELYKKGIKWKTYHNPMRDDGLFVAEDLPLEPFGEGMLGNLLYPAVPKTEHSLGYQLPHELAERLVSMLNGGLEQ